MSLKIATLTTDRRIIRFDLDLKISKKAITKRITYNYKRVNWDSLK